MEEDWVHLSQHTAFGLGPLLPDYARRGNRINGLSPGAHPRPAHSGAPPGCPMGPTFLFLWVGNHEPRRSVLESAPSQRTKKLNPKGGGGINPRITQQAR